MKDHVTRGRLNDLLDGLLPEEEAASVRAHLDSCGACSRDHQRLAELLRDLHDLPDRATPPHDLWPGIEERMIRGAEAGTGGGAQVLAFPATFGARRTRSVSLPAAAAAAIALSALSAGTVWWAMAGARPAVREVVAPVAEASASGSTALLVASGSAEYEEAVARLADLIDQGRGVLAPETVETLDASLETVEQALAEVREALAADPSSEILARMLVSHQQAKLRLLRRAALSIQAAS